MKIKTVFFDFDGVIVDSEKIYKMFWIKAINLEGFNINDEQVLNLRSSDKIVATKYLHDNISSTIDLDEYNKIRNLRIKMMNEYLKDHHFKLKRGVKELLDYLYANNIDCYIVSSSYKEDILRYLKEFKIDKYFKDVLSTKNISKGKPYPDVYELASSLVSTNKENILAIEDSPNGIISAYQAKLKTCMIPDLSYPDSNLIKIIDILQLDLIKLKEYLSNNNII